MVVVIVGAGGIGAAAAKRFGNEHLLVLADFSQEILDSTTIELSALGYGFRTCVVDVSNRQSVLALVNFASSLGSINTVVHTAGLSPAQAPSVQIYSVDLLGTAILIDAFQPVMAAGSSLVVIASIAAAVGASDLPDEAQKHFATAPITELLQTPVIDVENDSPVRAYAVSKRANILRVAGVAGAFGARGARVNSVSPGIIATRMGQAELDSSTGNQVRDMIAAAPIKRVGTAADVAEAVAFLTSTAASYITGIDLVVDGGGLAAISMLSASS